MVKTMFHTQENRGAFLHAPLLCYKSNAWLGEGYYFWYDFRDAKEWGKNAKNNTGQYDVYKADIDCENVLDTVFNEEHYLFWLKQIEKASEIISRNMHKKPNIKILNQYFKERGQWQSVAAVLFQDVPMNEQNTRVSGFYYRKRIQMSVYNTEIISNFVHSFSAAVPRK